MNALVASRPGTANAHRLGTPHRSIARDPADNRILLIDFDLCRHSTSC
jgi:hypothetical protein